MSSLAFVSRMRTGPGYSPELASNAHDHASWAKPLGVVWDPLLKADPEGPTLLIIAACAHRTSDHADLPLRVLLQHTAIAAPPPAPAKAGAAAALRVGGELDLGGVPRIKSGGRPEWPTHVARCSRHRSAGSSLQPASQPSPPACAGTSLGLAKNRPDS